MDLLERQEQLDELSRLLREAGKSAGKVAFVRGEAGAGKSSLVEQFASLAAGAPVYWGHCDALQTSRVLGPVKELAAEIGSVLDSELPRDKLFARLFEQFSPPNPQCVVVLEDLHWADEATLDFVRFVGRRIQRTRCLVVATFRDDEVGLSHLLRGVLGELTGQHVARIAVPPLSLAAVEQLAEGTLRDAGHIYRVSEGNPFFVRELLSAPLDTIPETVRDAVLTRLLQCSPAALELAELVSLVPGRADNWLTSALLGDIGEAADEAAARGLLRHHEAALGFRHELGRLAVESTIPRARARSMHRSILEQLVKRDADVSRLVHHASQAEDIDSVLRYAPRAAQQAAFAGAHREAIAHLATALRHAEALAAPERARLFKLHAAECNTANRIPSSLESANRALALYRELGERAAEANSMLLLGRGYWKSGKADLATRHITEAIALLENGPESRDLAMAYSMRSQLAMTADSTGEALSYGQRALDLATRFDDHEVRAHALNNLGCALLNAGDFSGMAKLESSLTVALEHNLQDHAGRAYANLVSTLVRQHRVELATRYISQGAAYAEVHDVQDTIVYIRAYVAQFELDRGRWEKAAQMAAELVQHPSLAIPPRIPTLVALASVRARRGDPGVDPLLDEAMRLALPTAELQRIGPVAALRAEVAWYRGEFERAAQEAALGLKAAEGHSDRWLIGQLAYWAHRAAPGTVLPREIAEPYALMIEGKWEAAADAWHLLEAPYQRALALADGPEEALREALAVLEQLGAGPLQAIVRQRLRDLGVRGLPRGPRASTRAHPAGLTSREVQVLNLLVHGHTNTELARRLHLSPKTVDHHVSAILEKLQVRSRTEAVAAAFGLGIVKAAR
jgi:DNA-binding CsgD family transcriptional regulator/tetratricopeptide (TPR) repeat protein